MADKKRLMCVDDFEKNLCHYCNTYMSEEPCEPGECWVHDVIAQTDTVDAVEVVRCKDCRFSAQHDPYDPMECVKWATKWGVCYTTPDGYCHKGERKMVNLEDIVDLDAQTKANNEAMRKVIDFIAGGADNERKSD